MKILKRVFCLLLCIVMLIAPFGCNETPDDSSNDDGGNNNENGGSDKENIEPLYKDYSALYNYLMTTYSTDINYLSNQQYPSTLIGKGKYENLPFAFLQAQGYNVDQIKNGTIDAECTTFIKHNEQNNLYMSVRVANQGPVPYYDMYLLKYELTDQEIYEYKYMFDPQYITCEGCFINDAISATKNASIISNNKMSIEMFDALQEYMLDHTQNIYGKRLGGSLILKDFDKDNNTFTLCIYGRLNNANDILIELPMRSGVLTTLECYNDILVGPTVCDNKYGFVYGKDYKNAEKISIRTYSDDGGLKVASVLDNIPPYKK